jgi:branched-chain amino acid transport system ATP-binding protein
VLTVEDLHVRHGKFLAVNGMSLTVERGEITLVLGANGAGKTTMLRCIAGAIPASSGRIELDGDAVLGRRPNELVRRGVVLVPEGRRVFGPLSVEENLRLGGHTISPREAGPLLDQIYELFPILRTRRSVQAGSLSGGEQQMLAFGRAMMAKPSHLLLDEPSLGLAPAMVEAAMENVRALAGSGVAVLMVEQNVDAALAVCDRLVVMAHGEAQFSGSADEARANSAVLLGFLGEAALRS